MIFGSTKSKLDHIIENGFRRIDEAVEGVIAKYPIEDAVNEYAPEHGILNNIAASGGLRSGNLNTELLAQMQGAAMASQRDWGIMGDLQRSGAGMAAQHNPMANAYQQGATAGLMGLHSFSGNTLI